MSSIVGHARILSFFKNARAHNLLSHAYCFSGPTHVGKQALAEYLAGELLEVSASALATHPDFLYLERDGKNITIEQITHVRATLAKSAFLGGYHIVIIDGAEYLNSSSANALLKTLEEPKKKAIIFLLTENETDLPETILSRCQLVMFAPVHDNDIAQHLRGLGVEEMRANHFVRHAHNLPGLAIHWANDGEAYEAYHETLEQFHSLWQKPFYKKLEIIEKVFGEKTDHLKTRDTLYAMLMAWEAALRDMLREGKKDQRQSLRIHEKINQAKKFIHENIHPRLLVEHILLEIP